MSKTQPSPGRRGSTTALALFLSALVLSALVAAAAVYVAGNASAPRERDFAAAVAAASGDPAILAAVQTKANQNRVMGGDAASVAAFQTLRPVGALTALPAQGDPVKGTFSPVFDWPLIGIHAVLTPDGRVLSYGSTATGARTGYYVYDVWDPQLGLGSASHNTLPNSTQVDIFCNAQLLLPDGNIEMWGGDVVNLEKGRARLEPNDDSARFNPLDNNLVRTGKMFRKRWYATATTLPDGEVYIQGGTGGEDFPEVRTGTGSFRLLSGASTTYLGGLYPRNFVALDGNIFGTRYEEMYRVDPAGTGVLTRVGRYTGGNMGASSTAVMFRPGQILQLGGGYDLDFASPLAHVIDITTARPVVRQVASPHYRRHWGNSTMLADGRVFVSGGSVADNDPVNGVDYTAEIYDPIGDTWRDAATAQRMRLYHSTALLLPDATVLTLGGGAIGPQLNLNAEIYYPQYLFDANGAPATRPIISASPMTANPGQTIALSTPDPGSITRVTLVKTGSVTHSFDMDQRFLELPFSVSGDSVRAILPANPFETPPGYYMVFVFDTRGVPSEAAILRINTLDPARLTVNKVVVNNDGGNKLPSAFSFSINGGEPIPFEADGSNVVNLPAGTYTVTEPASPDYAATLSGCNGIVLAAGGSATCTITNNDIPGFFASIGSSKDVYLPGETVTLTARVTYMGSPVGGARVNFDALKPNGVNHVYATATTDSSGNASASFVSGTGASSIGTYQLSATITSGSRSTQATATFAVLKPLPATLTVRKMLVNENGGSKEVSDFSFSVNGGAPIAFIEGGNVLNLAAGTYTVVETPAPGYTPSYANCSNLVLAAGDIATCTITNYDVALPTTTGLVATAGTSKPLYAAGETVTMFAHVVNGDAPVAGARVNFDALKPNGINHVILAGTTNANGDASVSFVSGTGTSSLGTYQLTATATSGGMSAQGLATFDVLKQAALPATLTVTKIVVNDNGGTLGPADFRFSVNGAAAVAFEVDGTNVLTVPAGTYTITEPATAGYVASLSNCTGLVLAAGGAATCTITNDDNAALAATVVSSKPAYIRGETVTLTAHVSRGGAPVSGARVNFDALKPNGVNHVILAGTTNTDGDAVVSFVSGTGPSSIGPYQLTATVTSSGETTQATATFVVQ
ncbi:galactose oxidase-like domain-containing protein [Lysobacter yangpyeongensis]|uniref:Galactose oxidase-like domain-containing protein n=1 Tax=Lysobacter yangpyeongensis TaxID=346182 RepID=A0ABW0SQJ3_9GAMM